ncbi:MAG: tRNA pseudouridine(55) synthase TruB [Chloroflexi bacterium]|nr:tRNA pseudouridine(55) synthase TruB [Chloroflexota bacterium]
MSIDGILNVNKPEGKTSSNVVVWLRRLTGEKYVGHGGTLDPIATGVLPVCFGQATRVTRFLTDSSKTYLAHIELGITTDTFDRQGKIIERRDPGAITVTQIEEALTNFQGVIEQVPPAYSALKHQGRRYYELARAGIPIELKPRQIKIIDIELINYKPPLITINVECSKGTYIRSLAHDMGQYLGCGAHIKNLTRLRCGPFPVEDALSLPQIEDAFQKGSWKESLYPMDSPLSNWEAIIVDKRNELAIRNGRSLSLDEAFLSSEKHCRAYNLDGYLIAVLHFIPEKKLWHPEKVFRLPQVSCSEQKGACQIYRFSEQEICYNNKNKTDS